MKIITNGDGIAKEVNPYEYPQGETPCQNSKYWAFDKEHPPLLLIDQNGATVKQKGEFEVEITRLPAPHPAILVYRLTSPIVPGINEPDITQPIEKESGYQTETVEEAAKIEMGVSYDEHMSGTDQIFIQGAIFGAKWQASQPNLISQEAVTEAITAEYKQLRDFISTVDNTLIRHKITIRAATNRTLSTLTDLLTTIKQL